MDWALPQMCQTILSDSIFLVNTHISPVLDDPFPYCHKHYCLSKKQSCSSCRSSIYRINKDKKKRERWHYLGCVSKVHNFSYSSFFFNKINILFHGGRKPLESSAYFLYKCGLSCRARCGDWTLPDNKRKYRPWKSVSVLHLSKDYLKLLLQIIVLWNVFPAEYGHS